MISAMEVMRKMADDYTNKLSLCMPLLFALFTLYYFTLLLYLTCYYAILLL
jgi:hypothetical protein